MKRGLGGKGTVGAPTSSQSGIEAGAAVAVVDHLGYVDDVPPVLA